jgi:hypothetical protein
LQILGLYNFCDAVTNSLCLIAFINATENTHLHPVRLLPLAVCIISRDASTKTAGVSSVLDAHIFVYSIWFPLSYTLDPDEAVANFPQNASYNHNPTSRRLTTVILSAETPLDEIVDGYRYSHTDPGIVQVAESVIAGLLDESDASNEVAVDDSIIIERRAGEVRSISVQNAIRICPKHCGFWQGEAGQPLTDLRLDRSDQPMKWSGTANSVRSNLFSNNSD